MSAKDLRERRREIVRELAVFERAPGPLTDEQVERYWKLADELEDIERKLEEK